MIGQVKVCGTCKVFAPLLSEYDKDFDEVHKLCSGVDIKEIWDVRPKRDKDSRHKDDGIYTNLADMTPVGRALVFERILERLLKQVTFIEDLLPDKDINALAKRLGFVPPAAFRASHLTEGGRRAGRTTRMLLEALVCMDKGEQVYVKGFNDQATIDLWQQLKDMAHKLRINPDLAEPCPPNTRGEKRKVFTDHYTGPRRR